jgi:hypothetical protein
MSQLRVEGETKQTVSGEIIIGANVAARGGSVPQKEVSSECEMDSSQRRSIPNDRM